MKKKEKCQEELVQEMIRHIVKKGVETLDDDELVKIAGESSKEVRTQLEALMCSDGCWCPDPPGGCHC